MIPPQLAFLAAQYGSKIIAIGALVVSLVAGYYYWKNEVASEAHEKAIAQCDESRNKFRIDAEHFKLARQEEIDKVNKQQSERVQDAIKTYITHYESMRNTPVATGLRVKTSSTGACSNAVPNTDQSRSGVTEGSERTGEAELSPRNLRQLNEVISSVEKLELKCEQLLNSVP